MMQYTTEVNFINFVKSIYIITKYFFLGMKMVKRRNIISNPEIICIMSKTSIAVTFVTLTFKTLKVSY